MSSNSISWTSFCQAMNSIAYWLLQNKRQYKKQVRFYILCCWGRLCQHKARAYNQENQRGTQKVIRRKL